MSEGMHLYIHIFSLSMLIASALVNRMLEKEVDFYKKESSKYFYMWLKLTDKPIKDK